MKTFWTLPFLKSYRFPDLSRLRYPAFALVYMLIYVISFPDNDWSFGKGVDSPLIWVYNYLFDQNLALGKRIIFPHGPLAFLMDPTYENILVFRFVLAILKLSLIYNLYKLLKFKREQTNWFLLIISSYLICAISPFRLFVFANALVMYVNYFNTKQNKYRIGIIVISAFAVFIKAYTGILCMAGFAGFNMYYLFRDKKYRWIIWNIVGLIMVVGFIWFLLYRDLNGISDYFVGLFYLGQDNSSAAAYYPDNNWYLLVPMFVITIYLYTLNKSDKSYFYFCIVGPVLFAAWKHGFAREDIFHVRGFLTFYIISALVFLLFEREKQFRKSLLIITGAMLISFNAKHAIGSYAVNHDYLRAGNFFEFVFGHGNLKYQAMKTTAKNLEDHVLPEDIRSRIGQNKVDVYPWDYSFIAINNLNWQPRRVIHSYAAYTSWLDNQNAAHFNDETKAPEFLILQKNAADNQNENEFSSIDERYLLNDEPNLMLTLISNYVPVEETSRVLLYKRRKTRIGDPVTSRSEIFKVGWNNWIKVPSPGEDELQRARIRFSKTIIQSIKSFLYKDEQFWISLKLENGKVLRHRIVPKNAVDGLWINPYIFRDHKALEVKEIMFETSNDLIISDEINLVYEKISFEKEIKKIESFFNCTRIRL